MGFGDEIMATGEARRLQRHDPRPVAIVDRRGRPRWHPIWAGNPRIARPAQVAAGLAVQRHVDGPGCRPYIARIEPERFVYNGHRAMRGEIHLTEAEIAFGHAHGGLVVVEPHVKATASPNKRWARARWRALVAARPELPWAQLGPAGTPILDGLRHVVTPSFRQACAVLSRARAAVLPEGGLHHAAAAFSLPAVVIYGAMVSPANTGYGGQVAIYRPHGDAGGPCGARTACDGCRAVLNGITVDEVIAGLEDIL